MPTATVLVTGASGFIAKHCIAELLRNDFSVRGTLRDLSRADAVRKSVARAGADACGVDFVTADLLNDDGWQMAMEDLHLRPVDAARRFHCRSPGTRTMSFAPRARAPCAS